MEMLISANALKQSIITERNYITPDNAHDIGMCNGLTLAHSLVLIAPTVDAVEVVRCKDCVMYNTNGCADGFGWCEAYNYGRMDNDYCSNGAKMDLEE